tara:strand:- start:443 stop:1033 length:591 start_codon:yes stop_codon:yes gene_type:complete
MAYIGNKPADTFHSVVKQSFTADSSTTAFTLNQSVVGENEVELFINNVRQEPGSGKAFTASGTSLTMSEAPATGDDMYCIFQGKAQGSHFVPTGSIQGTHLHTTFDLTGKTVTLPNATVTSTHVSQHLSHSKDTATGDASTTAFTIAANRTVEDVLLFVNGVCLVPTDDYTISGTTLTFATAPGSGAEIQFRYLPK